MVDRVLLKLRIRGGSRLDPMDLGSRDLHLE